mgnify:CR=1 FL=1
MASISINAAGLCIELNCGAGEDNVTFSAQDIYEAWKDWMLLADNSKYPQAMDAVGAEDLGGGEKLGNAFFLVTGNGWRLCPITVEIPTKITIDGNLFSSPAGQDLLDYSGAAGCVFTEIRTSTLPSIIETGVSGLTSAESDDLAQIDAVAALATQIQILVDELHKLQGLDVANPMTVTKTSRSVAGIVQDITGDGVNTTTVTRQ